jgi:uncharacterized protein
MRTPIVVSLLIAVGALAGGLYFIAQTTPPYAATASTTSTPTTFSDTRVRGGRYMFNITLHTTEEIDSLLSRAEQLTKTKHPDASESGIALVLHGPEIAIFTTKNYNRYKNLVDKAERLDADGVIEIKMCQTAMRELGIKEQEIPGFVEFVPFGPDEVERLKHQGYVYL